MEKILHVINIVIFFSFSIFFFFFASKKHDNALKNEILFGTNQTMERK